MSGLGIEFKTLKETSVKGLQPQPTQSWAVREQVLDSLQLLLIATYDAIDQLGFVPDPNSINK